MPAARRFFRDGVSRQATIEASPDAPDAVTQPDRVALARLWAVALTVLSFLPFVNWIDGGHKMPIYELLSTEWLTGSLISLGMALVLFIVVRRFGWWPSGWGRLSDTATRHANATAAVLGAFALGLYALVSRKVLSGRSLNIDEMVQVMQARIFAEGRLSRVADAHPEFFSALNVVDVNGSVFSQFPPGGPLMLLPGELAGLTWLSGPVFGAIAIVAFWRLVRSTETPGTALGAAALLAITPFMAFMAGSHMNHVPTLAWLCLALVGLRAVTSDEPAGPLAAFCTGLSLGMMTSIRPMDGAVFALPAGLWLLWRTIHRQLPVASLLASGVGIALPVIGVLAFNKATTGDATLFGYELLWGASHEMGFHQPPWGVTHTPARGFELVNMYFLRLQTYLFETPLPSLVPIIAALALVRKLSAFDRYLLVSSALVVAGYFAYWHDGFYLGPRFYYVLLPMLVLWAARLPAIVRDRFPGRGYERFVFLAYAVSALVSVAATLPTRVHQYAGLIWIARPDYLAPAARAGVENAVILVRESWGAQMIARLWGMDVSRPVTEALYRTVDACVLETAITELEAQGIRGEAAMERLRPLAKDSLKVVESTLSPDGTLRYLPGARYTQTCERRLAEDRGGYAFLAPLLARDMGTNLYARDLHSRNPLLLDRYRDRPVYLLRSVSPEVYAPLMLEPLRLDSARAEWGIGPDASR